MSQQLRIVTKITITVAVALPLLFHAYFYCYNSVEELSPAEVRTLLSKSNKCTLVDVRPKVFFEDEHAKGARWWPLREIMSLNGANDLPKSFRGKKLYCICSIGVQSMVAAQKLCSIGVEAANVRGGMALWQSERAMFAPCAQAQIGTIVRFILAPLVFLVALLLCWHRALPSFPLVAITTSALALLLDTTFFGGQSEGLYYLVIICQSLALSWLMYELLAFINTGARLTLSLGTIAISYLLLRAVPRAIGTLTSLLNSGEPWTYSILRQNFATTYLGNHGLLMIALALIAFFVERSFSGSYGRLFLAGASAPVFVGGVTLLFTTLLSTRPSLLLLSQHILAFGYPLLILLCWRKCVSCSPTNENS